MGVINAHNSAVVESKIYSVIGIGRNLYMGNSAIIKSGNGIKYQRITCLWIIPPNKKAVVACQIHFVVGIVVVARTNKTPNILRSIEGTRKACTAIRRTIITCINIGSKPKLWLVLVYVAKCPIATCYFNGTANIGRI